MDGGSKSSVERGAAHADRGAQKASESEDVKDASLHRRADGQTGALTKQKGEAKGRNVTPPSMDSSSKASTYGKAKGHANHWAKPRRCPRRLVKKGRGD